MHSCIHIQGTYMANMLKTEIMSNHQNNISSGQKYKKLYEDT